jgi:hypothetical protein
MKLLITLAFILFAVTSMHAQNNMLVNQQYEENRYYGTYMKLVDSTQLPENIHACLRKFLRRYFGELSDSVHFINAQVVSLEQYFKESTPGDYEWIVPAYDVHYYISISSTYIQRYNVEVKLDQYGQLISINWPQKGYVDRHSFRDTASIKTYALQWAADHKIPINPYTIKFTFDEYYRQLVWIFNFVKEADMSYIGLTLSAKNNEIIEAWEGKNIHVQ